MPTRELSSLQLAIRRAPISTVAWPRTYAVVLPCITETYDLSATRAGQFVSWFESGQLLLLLLLAFWVDRIGAARTLHIGLPILAYVVLSPHESHVWHGPPLGGTGTHPLVGRHSRSPNRSDSVKSLLGVPTIITGVVPPAVIGIVGRNFVLHFWLALGAALLTGVGVSSTFQLGTTWAAELVPQREGTASTAIVAFAALGLVV